MKILHIDVATAETERTQRYGLFVCSDLIGANEKDQPRFSMGT
jgi:hypothetical protein